MSGGTPPAGGYMRQRHSQGYASSGDDIEDDACSRPRAQSPSFPQPRTRFEVLESVLWIASAIFIVYYGDRNSNFFYILLHDDRIRRVPLYLGIFGVALNVGFFLYTSLFVWSGQKANEKWDISSSAALPFITLLGLVSFCLFNLALWPIWRFLTPPLVFTLFMACMVVLPYLVLGRFRPQLDDLRTD